VFFFVCWGGGCGRVFWGLGWLVVFFFCVVASIWGSSLSSFCQRLGALCSASRLLSSQKFESPRGDSVALGPLLQGPQRFSPPELFATFFPCYSNLILYSHRAVAHASASPLWTMNPLILTFVSLSKYRRDSILSPLLFWRGKDCLEFFFALRYIKRFPHRQSVPHSSSPTRDLFFFFFFLLSDDPSRPLLARLELAVQEVLDLSFLLHPRSFFLG